MMKFRFGDPSKRTFLAKHGSLIYMFFGWNVVGYFIYTLYWPKSPAGNGKSTRDQTVQAALKGTGPEVRRIRFEGFSVKENKVYTKEEKEEDN